jgi:hypothetical protein
MKEVQERKGIDWFLIEVLGMFLQIRVSFINQILFQFIYKTIKILNFGN